MVNGVIFICRVGHMSIFRVWHTANGHGYYGCPTMTGNLVKYVDWLRLIWKFSYVWIDYECIEIFCICEEVADNGHGYSGWPEVNGNLLYIRTIIGYDYRCYGRPGWNGNYGICRLFELVMWVNVHGTTMVVVFIYYSYMHVNWRSSAWGVAKSLFKIPFCSRGWFLWTLLLGLCTSRVAL